MEMKRQIRLVISAALFIFSVTASGAEQQDIDQLQLDWFKVSTLRNVRDVYPKVSLEIAESNAPEPNFTSQIGPLTQKDLQGPKRCG